MSSSARGGISIVGVASASDVPGNVTDANGSSLGLFLMPGVGIGVWNGGVAGESGTAGPPCRELVELWALGLVLPGTRFFLSLLGCLISFRSPSLVGDFEKKFETLRSFVGVIEGG